TPLAFAWRKAGTWGIYASLLVTFALIGLWHGANWTYVVFGTLQGFYIVCSLAKKKFRRWLLARTGIAKIPWIETSLAIGGTFLFFSFSLVFFRAVSMSQAWQIVEKIADAFVHFLTYAVHWRDVLNYQNLGVGIRVFLLVCTGICALEYVEWLKAKKGTPFIFDDKPKPVRFVWYYALVFSILIAGSFGSQAFIYFKF
ncbi:hypothetical protein KGQ74_02715, partial [Patescibacteria group bacterium]|nr:hypothetical protein [Patescibacteria group bacterium]